MYRGPDPRDIDINFPEHTYEFIVCLLDGSQRKIIQERTLKNDYGVTKKEYLEKFPEAPLMSLSAKEQRSKTMRSLNLNNKDFQEKRKKASKEFLDSDRSLEYRKAQAEKAKEQHKNGLDISVKKYFEERYIGSNDQKDRKTRFKKNNPNYKIGVREKKKETYIKNSELGLHNRETKYKKKKYKDTNLIYQSRYELDFLEFCEKNNILDKIQNSPCFTDENYPYNFYAPDYIFDKEYVVEIKSWYIENLQEKRYPGILDIKKNLIESKGYKFLYIRDKDYSVLDYILS